MVGLIDIATYVPSYEVDVVGDGRSARTAASFDEDTTTMAVAAVRQLAEYSQREAATLWFATSSPAYEAKSNAVTVHAACQLRGDIGVFDQGPSVRSAFGATRAAAETAGIAAIADQWSGLPGSDDERRGADAAVAMSFGSDADSIAVIERWVSSPIEVLERWRVPGEAITHVWDERFLAESLHELTTALALDEGVAGADRIIVSSPNSRIARTMPAALGVAEVVAESADGYAGGADPWIRLQRALGTALPGSRIAIVCVADGVEVMVLRCTERIREWQLERSLQADTRARSRIDYLTYLTWRGLVTRQPPRRPDPPSPSAPPSLRSRAWKYGLVGGRCPECATLHAPPESRCRNCSASPLVPEPLARRSGRVATMTVDRLAYSLDPPTVIAVVDFDGARASFEVADGDRERISIGDEVEFSFRRLHTSDGIHNYFWKAVPRRRTIDPETEH